MKVKLYVEGGGVRKSTKSACRKGFRRFVEKSGLKGSMPDIIASGSRRKAYDDFAKSNKLAANNDENVLLLVDAEGPVVEAKPWQHLIERDGWNRPEGAKDEQCHLMVQAMESWFLADRTALSAYYGQGFQENPLPSNPQIEQVAKNDVLKAIRQATRGTTKGRYDKGRHSFEILAKIDPSKVTNASLHARRFVETLFKFAGRGAAGDKDPSSG